MSQNKTLKAGDLVRMHLNEPNLGRYYFGVGQFYMVRQHSNGALFVTSSVGVMIDLVTPQGQMTDFADYFTKHKCPVVLPVGNQKEGA